MNMSFLNSQQGIIFYTKDYAKALEIDNTNASRKLSSLEKKGAITKITRGLWANTLHPYFNAYSAIPYLLASEQGYLSFLNVLHEHGLISQIPRKIYVATTGHSRVLQSPVGNFEFIKLKPSLANMGVNWSKTKVPYLKASLEKALFDTLYISTRKGNRFASLPELDFSETNFDKEIFDELVKSSKLSSRITNSIYRKLENYLSTNFD